MATKDFPYGDDPRLATPYAKAFASQPAPAQQAPAPLTGAEAQQANYDEVARTARELNARGYGWNAAQETARQMFAQKQETAKVKDQMLLNQAAMARMELAKQSNDLTKQQKLTDAITGSYSLDPERVDFPDQLNEWEKSHFGALHNEDPEIARQVQERAKELTEAHSRHSSGIEKELNKWGYTAVPPEAIDPATHKINHAKLDELGNAHYQSLYKQKRQEAADIALDAAKARIAAEREADVEKAKSLMDAGIKLSDEQKIMLGMKVRKELQQNAADVKNAGFSLSGKPAATKPSADTTPLPSVQPAATTEQPVKKDSKTLVYDPSTGTFSPK